MTSLNSKEEQNRRSSGYRQREMPNYWPAEKVPYINISYCHLIQGVFGVFFLSALAYVVFGAK